MTDDHLPVVEVPEVMLFRKCGPSLEVRRAIKVVKSGQKGALGCPQNGDLGLTLCVDSFVPTFQPQQLWTNKDSREHDQLFRLL